MQVAQTIADVRAEIEAAFGDAEVPPTEAVLAAASRDSIDAGELLAAFRGKHWRDLDPREVFIHRESLSSLSARGYRAYVAAYLVGGLAGEYADDVAEYAELSLQPLSDEPGARTETDERLGALDPAQRAAIASWLRLLAPRSDRAAGILASWA